MYIPNYPLRFTSCVLVAVYASQEGTTRVVRPPPSGMSPPPREEIQMDLMLTALARMQGGLEQLEPQGLPKHIGYFVLRLKMLLGECRDYLVQQLGQEVVDKLVEFYRPDLLPTCFEPDVILSNTTDPAEFVAFARIFKIGKFMVVIC